MSTEFYKIGKAVADGVRSKHPRLMNATHPPPVDKFLSFLCQIVILRSTLISSLKININSPVFDKSAPELFAKIGLIFKTISPASGRKYRCRVDLMTTIGSTIFELALDVRIFGNPSVFVKKTWKNGYFHAKFEIEFYRKECVNDILKDKAKRIHPWPDGTARVASLN